MSTVYKVDIDINNKVRISGTELDQLNKSCYSELLYHIHSLVVLMRDKETDRVRTTEQSLQIIDEIQSRKGATLAEIVDHFDLAKSTVHRHLTTLRHHGYIVKEGEEYNIGLKFYNKGAHARTRKQSYQLVAEAVQDLADITEEEIDFLVPNNNRAIVVHASYHRNSTYQQEVIHPIEVGQHAGTYYHLHSTAGGKAILAEFSDEKIDRVIDQWGLPKRTENTHTSRADLFEDLNKIRERGVALSNEEYAYGLRAVGRRVLSPDGSVLGAVSLSAPAYRLSTDIMAEEVTELLISTIDELEDELDTSSVPPTD